MKEQMTNPYMPLMIMNIILVVVAILLALADKILINYGDCKISIEQDEKKKEFTVKGGATLLSALIENDIPISASCGGKASCGYCKCNVTKGGGQILPTEEIFMSREEMENDVRLACQVKVKEDVDIFIPDLLTTVRSIVASESFDAKMRWQFNINKQPKLILEPDGNSRKKLKIPEIDIEKVHHIIDENKETPGALMPILHGINNHFNYLPEFALKATSKALAMPFSRVYRLTTFYNAFSLTPTGLNKVSVCLGTACHVKGASNVLSELEKELGIKNGETTEDRNFTLEGVRCIGCCGLAPVLKVNEDVHGLMTNKKVAGLIKQYQGA
jgi:NADH:ubiquinone oxidoreductase subunit E/ferredoxin